MTIPTTRAPAPSPTCPENREGRQALCFGCGCLCDDVEVSDGIPGVFQPAARFCHLGQSWLASASRGGDADSPIALRLGRSVTANDALAEAARILTTARRPLIYGATRTTTEAVRAALALADRARALLVLATSPSAWAASAAFQDLGRVKATLGEVKNRADLVIFWGCDPLTSNPRHFERFSVDPPGRFVPEGRRGRKVVVVDAAPTPTSRAADLVIELPRSLDPEALSYLRLGLRDPGLGDFKPAVHRAALDQLVGLMKQAHYGALFFEAGTEAPAQARMAWDAATALIRDTNEVSRFVLMSLGSAGNQAGAEAALAWQAGFAPGVDFRFGYPTPVDEPEALVRCLERREADALLVVCDEPPRGLTDAAAYALAEIPRIVIGPDPGTWAGLPATVALRSGVLGLDEVGSVTRCDGICLPVRALRAPVAPGVASWLGRLIETMGP